MKETNYIISTYLGRSPRLIIYYTLTIQFDKNENIWHLLPFFDDYRFSKRKEINTFFIQYRKEKLRKKMVHRLTRYILDSPYQSLDFSFSFGMNCST